MKNFICFFIFNFLIFFKNSYSLELERKINNGYLYIPNQIKIDLLSSGLLEDYIEIRELQIKSGTLNQIAIPPHLKNEYEANIEWENENGKTIRDTAKISIHGQYTDHLSFLYKNFSKIDLGEYNNNNENPYSSFKIKLQNQNLSGLTSFRLFIPPSRGGEAEIFLTSIMDEIGFISPYTKNVSVNFNDQIVQMIFEENMSKESLEKRNLLEAPIIENDFREVLYDSLYPYNFDNTYFSGLNSIKNAKILKQSKMDQIVIDSISMSNADLLNIYQSDIQKLKKDNNIYDFELYISALLYSLANHGIAKSNLRFYFDPQYRKLLPIYWDGMILNFHKNWDALSKKKIETYINETHKHVKNYEIQKEFLLLSNYFKDKNNQEKVYLNYKSRNGVYSQEFINQVFSTLNKISFGVSEKISQPNSNQNFEPENDSNINQFNEVNFNTSLEKVDKNSQIFFSGLMNKNSVICQKVGKNRNQILPQHGQYIINDHKNIYNFKNVFIDDNTLDCKEVHIEDLRKTILQENDVYTDFYKENSLRANLKKCSSLSRFFLKLFIKIDFVKRSYVDNCLTNDDFYKKPIFFLGNMYSKKIDNEDHIFLHDVLSKEFKFLEYKDGKYIESNTLQFNLEPDEILYLKSHKELDNKKIIIHAKYDSSSISRVIFDSGEFINIELKLKYSGKEKSNLKIVNTNIFNEKLNNVFITNSILLNGCVTFLDSKIKDLKIDINNSYCEDSVNTIRASGNILSLNITNSASDSVDFDFSDIDVSNAFIKNSVNDCIDLSYGEYNFDDIKVENCGDKGVSIGVSYFLNNLFRYLNRFI